MSRDRDIEALFDAPVVCVQGPPCGSNRSRIFILSNVKLYREGLALSLSQRPQLDVIGDAALSADVLARVANAAPAVVLLDLTAPGVLNVSRDLSRSGIKVIAFGVSDIDDELITCAEAGVTGIVTKEASVDDLVASIWNALRGEVTCSPRVTGLLLKRLDALSDGAAPHGKWVLTRRQREVMELVTKACPTRTSPGPCGSALPR